MKVEEIRLGLELVWQEASLVSRFRLMRSSLNVALHTARYGKTTGVPNLILIGHYRMGFKLSPHGNGSTLCVFIDYALPERVPAHWLGRLFGPYYARRCTQQMVSAAVKHFTARSSTRLE